MARADPPDVWPEGRDPRYTYVSLAELAAFFRATIALVSAPEKDANQEPVMLIVEQLPDKVHEYFNVVSLVDFSGSASAHICARTVVATSGGTLRCGDKDFEENLTETTFNNSEKAYVERHRNHLFGPFFARQKKEFEEQVMRRHRKHPDAPKKGFEQEVLEAAKLAFAVRNSHWMNLWRGKVLGGLSSLLATASTFTYPDSRAGDRALGLGLGSGVPFGGPFGDSDNRNGCRCVLAVAIRGGMVSRQEQQELPTLVDQVTNDLRRRCLNWAGRAAIATIYFNSVDGFLRSLRGQRNLRRGTSMRRSCRDVFFLQREDGSQHKVTLPLEWKEHVIKEGPKDVGAVKAREKGDSDSESGNSARENWDNAVKKITARKHLHAAALEAAKNHCQHGVPLSMEELKKPRVFDLRSLQRAARNGDADGVRYLHRRGARFNEDLGGKLNDTVLIEACKEGHSDVARAVCDCAAKDVGMFEYVNIKGVFDRTALYYAAGSGDAATVKFLLNAKAVADVITSDGYSWTPAFKAAESGNDEVVQLLLHARANFDHYDASGWTPLGTAVENNRFSVAKLLLKIGVGGDVNQQNKQGQTMVSVALERNYRALFRLLLDWRADIEKGCSDGTSPLTLAAKAGNIETLKFLMSIHADVNKASKEGYTPTYLACKYCHTEALELLIGARANVEREAESDGATPAHAAAQSDFAAGLRLLFTARANLDIGMVDGRSPTFLAAEGGNVQALSVLVAKKASVNRPTGDQRSPLAIAVEAGFPDIVRTLVARDAEIERRNTSGITPLMQAALKCEACVDILLDAHANVHSREFAQGATALILAAQVGHVASVRLLVNGRASVSEFDTHGLMPVHAAAANGHCSVLQFLIKARSDPANRTRDGSTAIDFATENGHKGAMNLLKLLA